MQSRHFYILQRVAIALVGLLAASFLVFFLLELSPDVVAVKVLGPYTPEGQRRLWLELNGYYEPFFKRYLIWLGQMVVGDFGESIRFKLAISEVLWHRLGQSALLIACTLALAIPLSLAITQAAGGDSKNHATLTTVGFVITAVPDFVSALFLITLFSVGLGLLPAVSPMAEGLSFEQLVLPVLVLAILHVGHTFVQGRSSRSQSAAKPSRLLSTLSQSVGALTWLLASLIPVEFIFAYKGFGALFLEALLNQDIFLIETCALVGFAIAIAAWLLADLFQAFAIPNGPEIPPETGAADETPPTAIDEERGKESVGGAPAVLRRPLIVLGSAILGIWALLAFAAPFLSPYDPTVPMVLLAQPGSADGSGGTFWLGTDHLGRDILSQTLWGATRVFLLAVMVMVGAYLLGGPLGVIAGLLRRRRPLVPPRSSALALSFPLFASCLLAIGTIGASAFHIVLVLVVVHGVSAIRTIRDLIADRSQLTLSNVAAGLILRFGLVVMTLSLLGFLGLGLPPPALEWGGMINETRMMLTAFPYMILPPCAAIASLILGARLLAAGLKGGR